MSPPDHRPGRGLPAPLDALPQAHQATMLDYLDKVEVAAGTRLFDAGDDGDGCYLIDEGIVRLDLPFDEVDSDVTLAYLEPGQLLGELALIDGTPRSAHATAETALTARHLPTKNLERLIEDHPVVAAGLLRVLGQDVARKLRTTTGQLAEHLVSEGRDPEVDRMVAAAGVAQADFAGWDEPRVDALLEDLANAIAARAQEFAAATVEVTKMGSVADKAAKNVMASVGVYRSLAGAPGSGMQGPASERGVTELTAPVGVIFGIIPVTNPIATAVYKSLIALKGRNALILSFHRICLPLAETFTAAVREVLRRHDAPVELLQSVRVRSSRQRTARFMSHPGVSLVVATGGPGIVHAAYRSGTPAIGVGAGNAPVWIASDADVAAAAAAIVASKSFDNGLICGAENHVVVDASVVETVRDQLEQAGAAVLTPEESGRFLVAAVTADGRDFRPELTGQDAAVIAAHLHIERAYPIRLLVIPGQPDLAHPITSEKMGPFVSLFTVDGDDAALALCAALLDKMGTGHTAMIHTADLTRVERFARRMPASRILVNAPGSQGICGLTTGLTPAFTLGCGTFGGTSTTDNVSWRNLVNVKRLATVQPPPADLDLE